MAISEIVNIDAKMKEGFDAEKVISRGRKRGKNSRKLGIRTSIIDVHIGQRLRALRIMRGLSQDKIGQLCGKISFQQIQKYEKGENRISASRLYFFGKVLETDIGFFFEGLDALLTDQMLELSEKGNLTFLSEINLNPSTRKTPNLESKETTELLKLYYSIEDEDVRSRVLELVKAIRPSALA